MGGWRWGMMVVLALGALGLHMGGGAAQTQSWPTRPVRIVIPFAAGGAVDELARIVGNKLGGAFNQPFVVESHAGVGGNLGADIVAKSAPDGYTILQTTNGQAISPSLYRSLSFDAVRDFIPVTQLVASTLVVVANPTQPLSSMPDLIKLAKLQPGKLNYGSSGVGNPLHLTMEMIKSAAGIDIVPVPYRSDAQINTALMAGDVQIAVVPLATSLPLISAGKLRALAVTSAHRSTVIPNVPTIAEEGIPGFASTSWQGFFVPAKTPREIVELLQRETAKALNAPDVRERLLALTYEPVGSTPEEFAAYFKSELEKFGRVVKDAHIPPQD